MNHPYDDKKLIRTQDAAAIIGVHPQTLVVWRAKGYGPPWFQYAYNMIAYAEEDVRQWMADQQRVANKPPNGHDVEEPPPKGVRETEAAAYFRNNPAQPRLTVKQREAAHFEKLCEQAAVDRVFAEARALTSGKGPK